MQICSKCPFSQNQNLKQGMAKLIALDYGTKRTGIAVTDDLQIFSFGLCTVETTKLLQFLEDFILKNTVEGIVLGYPKRLDGSDTHNTKPVEDFFEQIKKKFPSINIYLEDERYTSKLAQESLIQMGVKKKERQKKEKLDELSAVFILRSFIEQKN